MKKRDNVPVFDLNFSAFHHLHGNTPELCKQGTRVSFLFKPDETFTRLSLRYQSNEPVNVLDYVSAIRALRARMLALKEEGNEKEQKHIAKTAW